MKVRFLLLLSLMLLIRSSGFSQITITFTVKVEGMYIGPGGVHIAGEFAKDSSTSILTNWYPGAAGSYMTLVSPNTYSVDVNFSNSVAGDSLQFEFERDSVWGNIYGDMSEGNPGDPLAYLNDSCGFPDGGGGYNRLIFIPACSGVYNCVFNYCSYIQSTPCDTLSFACSNQNICEKFCVDFTDSSANNATSWQWDFPGGTPSSSTEQNPANICYDIPGSYDVTLTTTGSSGSQTLTIQNYVHVNATPAIPTIIQNGFTLTSSAAAYYQWQLNAVDIPGATDQSYVVQQSGYYTVLISNESGCANSASVYVSMVGIDEIENVFQLSVSPNPFSESTTINWQFSNRENVSLKIYDLEGRLIRTLANDMMSEGAHAFTWNAQDENGNEVSDGIYFLRMQTADEAKTIRLSIVK